MYDICDLQAFLPKTEQVAYCASVDFEDSIPDSLYKILSVDDWAKSDGVVHLPSSDALFIHFATEEQLAGVIAKYWSGVSEYVVLKIDPSKLSGNLVFEANPGGVNKYYHLYSGEIPFDAVIGVRMNLSE